MNCDVWSFCVADAGFGSKNVFDKSADAVRIVLADGCVVALTRLLIDRVDENYALASTQSLKNKDIPEGKFRAVSIR